ncbi:DNRLRE domain-containing protein [Streptomyces sp. NPDC013161]|uniref:DNRLRE domain-containing protein n=1 Tax=Streptomyces sp. NPDC013161 TaxID=3364862 RepID=UPI0036B4EE49
MQELKSSTYDGGTDTARSYLKSDVSKFAGKHITAATMSLYNNHSSTCSTSGAATQARRITSAWPSLSRPRVQTAKSHERRPGAPRHPATWQCTRPQLNT